MSDIVPPRRGQRIKNPILPPFNGGEAFSVSQHRNGKGGIVRRRCGSHHTSVWFEFDLIPSICKNKHLKAVSCSEVPPQAYHEYKAVIGGVGKHFRWKVVMVKKKQGGNTCLLRVDSIQNFDEFCAFVREKLEPLAQSSTIQREGTENALVTVTDELHIGIVAAAFHCAGYGACPVDPGAMGKLAIERFDRSVHMWWNQEPKEAGPLRDVHRWVFDFMPTCWTKIPFTWEALCANIAIDPLTESEHLPRPLRDVYLTTKIAEAEPGNDSYIRKLESMRGPPSVTCRLSEKQNRQLLQATYWNLIAPFEKLANLHICKLIRFRYMLHGYMAREIGEYKQTASNLGHGATIRNFKNKPQYQAQNLPNNVLNRIYQVDGTMRGSGFKGTRGRYGHEDFPKYIPSKRMKRASVQERRVRLVSTNPFEHYNQNDTGKDQE